jgi:hypothetical protein
MRSLCGQNGRRTEHDTRDRTWTYQLPLIVELAPHRCRETRVTLHNERRAYQYRRTEARDSPAGLSAKCQDSAVGLVSGVDEVEKKSGKGSSLAPSPGTLASGARFAGSAS